MKLPFGLELRRRQVLNSIPGSGTGGWFNVLRSTDSEFAPFQQNNYETATRTSLLASSAVYCCVTGISTDIAKLRIRLMKKAGKIWEEIEDSPYLPVLNNPNEYQTRFQFTQQWIQSLLLFGNAYIALERDNRGGEGRGVPSAMYALDPCKVRPMISDSGDVFYEVDTDILTRIEDRIVIPAENIIHDRINPLWHPLIGVPPITACAASAYTVTKIQGDQAQFFSNKAMPGGMLTAPARISDETAARMKTAFEENFSGANIGKLFVAGDGLKFEPFKMTAEQSQLVEQLQWGVSDVGRAFHYPAWKMGGPMPAYGKDYQAYQLSYFADALHGLIEGLEYSIDKAFGFDSVVKGVELDTDNLLRMDTAALYEAINKGERFMEVNEQRLKAGYGPTEGGDQIYRQHQDHSLEALAARDKGPDPFGTAKETPANPQPADPNAKPDNDARNVRELLFA